VNKPSFNLINYKFSVTIKYSALFVMFVWFVCVQTQNVITMSDDDFKWLYSVHQIETFILPTINYCTSV